MSYVQVTGEVYAAHGRGLVVVLGAVPADTQGPEVYYHTLDRILDGWPGRCGQPNGLSWVVNRLREYGEGYAPSNPEPVEGHWIP